MSLSINKFMNYVAIVLDLIHRQEWAALEKVATTKHKLFKVISEHIKKCDEFNGMTLLHAARCTHGQDCVGRTPLHVACGTGADAEIIRLLVEAYPQACDLQDEDGRLPLHLACDIECVLFEGDQTERAPPTIDVVRALLSGSWRSVLVEDEDEMSPIEYAIVSDANIKVVKLLQKTSMTLRRKEAQANCKKYSKGY
ncbi:hypothetical protein QTG54_004961 [Skeletonema marinoi]|uniref:Uncharacterized protein n=1 Tax=Skeletonema marinoi TaxID=267567 RepID=A0AAD8YDT9_9STRA|nr:hypothetical protein QTG54_004961 [Skeletonema marinoi]